MSVSGSKTAIVAPDGMLTFAQLARKIGERAPGVARLDREPSGLLPLEADFTTEFVVNLLAALDAGVPVRVHAPGDLTPPPEALSDDRTAIVLGRVEHSSRSLDENTYTVIESLKLTEVDQQLLFLPLSHASGLLGQLLPGLAAGVTTRLVPSFDEVPELLKDFGFRCALSGEPSHLNALRSLPRDLRRGSVTRGAQGKARYSFP
jgi:long-chain acyl-CoA synthetase